MIMDQQAAEVVLTDIIARWDKGDNQELGRELVKRLDLKCAYPWEPYARQVSKLVNRRLKNGEKAILDYFYDMLCKGGGNLGTAQEFDE
jgi:hypothetical protein